MDAKWKKILNRSGAIIMVVGSVAFAIGGGTTEAATSIVGLAISAVGAVAIVIREVIG